MQKTESHYLNKKFCFLKKDLIKFYHISSSPSRKPPARLQDELTVYISVNKTFSAFYLC